MLIAYVVGMNASGQKLQSWKKVRNDKDGEMFIAQAYAKLVGLHPSAKGLLTYGILRPGFQEKD